MEPEDEKEKANRQDWSRKVSLFGKSSREVFRIITILVLIVPFGVLLYILYEDNQLSLLFEVKNILLFGLVLIIVLAVLAILQRIFDRLSTMSAMMSKAILSGNNVTGLVEETRELQEISHAFRELLDHYDATSRELTRLSQLFVAMKELGEAAARNLEMPALFSMLLSRAMQATGAKAGSVIMVDEERDKIRPVSLHGLKLKVDEIPVDGPMLHRLLQDRTPVLTDDPESDPFIRIHFDSELGEFSFMSIPILLDSRLLGILSLAHSDQSGGFSDADVDLLLTMISQVKFSLENTYAHERVKEHARSLGERTIQLKREISRRKEVEIKLEALALKDPLTGLPNRHQFLVLLEQAISEALRRKDKLAVLFIDLDRFKTVNDSQGHEVGDWVLKEVADRMRSMVRGEDIVARYGGDEFTCVLFEVHDQESVGKVAEKLAAAISKPIQVNHGEYFIGASIGIALFPEGGKTVSELVKNADAAMYSIKEIGGHKHCFYNSDIGDSVNQRVQLETDLHRAVSNHEFELHYQPQVDLRSGKLSGIEALLRWQHPSLGLLSPDSFIPLAEQTGLIVPIGRWVLNEACDQYKRWRDSGLVSEETPLNIAVNVSAQQLVYGDFMQDIVVVLEKTGLPPEMLELEITESVIMEAADRATEILHEIKSLGVNLAMDDFGSGFSSLSYIKHFPIDTLKIDKVFVRHLPDDHNDTAIVRAILELAYSLDMHVVAEGVEKLEQLTFLRSNGCHAAQGYLLGRPVESDELLSMIRDQGVQEKWHEMLSSQS